MSLCFLTQERRGFRLSCFMTLVFNNRALIQLNSWHGSIRINNMGLIRLLAYSVHRENKQKCLKNKYLLY